MIKFTTINVDGNEVTREFTNVEDIKRDWFDEENGTTLPAGDDEVISATIGDIPIVVPMDKYGVHSFLGLLYILGVEEYPNIVSANNENSFDIRDLVADEVDDNATIDLVVDNLKHSELFLQTLDNWVADAISQVN